MNPSARRNRLSALRGAIRLARQCSSCPSSNPYFAHQSRPRGLQINVAYSRSYHVSPNRPQLSAIHRQNEFHLSPQLVQLTRQRRPFQSSHRSGVTALLFRKNDENQYDNGLPKPWHDPEFMNDSTPEQIEAWLIDLLKLIQDAGGGSFDVHANDIYPTSSQNPKLNFHVYCHGSEQGLMIVDSYAYLRVLEAFAGRKELERSNDGDKTKLSNGDPRRAEYWLLKLEKHYEAALESFHAVYGIGIVEKADVCKQSISPVKVKSPSKLSPFASLASSNTTSESHQSVSDNGITTLRPPDSINQEMEKVATIVRSLQPTVHHYNSVIKAWAHDSDSISVARSRRWLSKLEDGPKNFDDSPDNLLIHTTLQPNDESYDLYLHSCSRGIGKKRHLLRERASEAEDILRYRMSLDAPSNIRPTTDSFNNVIRAWTRCRKDYSVADRVLNLVREMEGIHREVIMKEQHKGQIIEEEKWKLNIIPDSKTYTMAIDSWVIAASVKAEKWYSEQRSQIHNTRRKSHRDGNNVTIHNYENRQENEDGTAEMRNAEAIMEYIRDLEEFGHVDPGAALIAYNTILSGWARLANEFRPDIAKKSEALLYEMIELSESGKENCAPDVLSYNAVIKAWAKSKRLNSADRAEWWLRKMIDGTCQQQSVHTVRPNVNSFNLVMEAFLQLNDASRVEDLLREMDATDGVITPNSESFSKVIRAWTRNALNTSNHSLQSYSIENARRWLEELLQRESQGQSELGPAPELFSSILKSAATCHDDSESLLSVGQWTFWAMRDSRFGVNSLAYEWLLDIGLKVLASQKDNKRREDFLISLVEQCCRDGLLSVRFVKSLSSGRVFDEGWTAGERERICRQIFGDAPFPMHWSRNLCGRYSTPTPEDFCVAKQGYLSEE